MSCIGKASHGGTSAGVSLKSSMTLTIAELHSLRCRLAELHSLICETHVFQTIAASPARTTTSTRAKSRTTLVENSAAKPVSFFRIKVLEMRIALIIETVLHQRANDKT